jgi:hypothetical protein
MKTKVARLDLALKLLVTAGVDISLSDLDMVGYDKVGGVDPSCPGIFAAEDAALGKPLQ